MPDFNVRADAVNVEQLMDQIRARIREKRGVDYTEEQIQDMAHVKLEKFLDPRGVRSDLLDQFRRSRPPYAPPELPNYAFEDHTMFESHRAPLRIMRKLLNPILKLFFNPNPLIQALNIQSKLNTMYAEREAKNEAARHTFDSLHYEVMHNLVVETTRLGIEVKNLKMKVESLTSRLEFNERRARALESVVVYKPADERTEAPAPETRPTPPQREPRDSRDNRERGGRDQRDFRGQRDQREPRESREPREPRDQREPREPRAPIHEPRAVEQPSPAVSGATETAPGLPPAPGAPPATAEGPGLRSRRRRRRRGRRGGGSAAAIMGEGQTAAAPGTEHQPTSHDSDDQSSAVDDRDDMDGGADTEPQEPGSSDQGQ